MNPLHALAACGQSIWMDYIERAFVTDGTLEGLIQRDELRGLTSNPVIFERAMTGGGAYDVAIRDLADRGATPEAIYEALALDDIRTAADAFRPVFDRLRGSDGFVSFEVSPHLAHDAEASVRSARDLWAAIDRPNAFIKIPGTVAGLAAIRQLIADGININVTLLFGLPRYREVIDAWLGGLEDRLAAGRPIGGVSSVASFFLSRIDVAVDPLIARRQQEGGLSAARAASLRGRVAIDSAKLAYQIYREMTASARFVRLREAGAAPQRLLWASTGTKHPEDPDLKYVEPLIGPETVTTLPPKTFEAYRDHGDPAARLEDGIEDARTALASLADLGIDLDAVTGQLEADGVQKFVTPFDHLMDALAGKRGHLLARP